MDSAGLSAASSTLASLFAIFLILGGAAVLLRRWRARLPAGNLQGAINIIAQRPLGGQHALVIAEAEGCRFLIGVSRNGLTAIGRLDAHE